MSQRAENGLINVPKTSKINQTEEAGSGASTESVETPRRRTFSAEYKRRIVKEAAAQVDRGEVGALLRREGLYSSHLTAWWRQFEAGGKAALSSRKPGRKRKKTAEQQRIEQLEKEKAKLENELYVARALLDLQKKASVLLGITFPALADSDDDR